MYAVPLLALLPAVALFHAADAHWEPQTYDAGDPHEDNYSNPYEHNKGYEGKKGNGKKKGGAKGHGNDDTYHQDGYHYSEPYPSFPYHYPYLYHPSHYSPFPYYPTHNAPMEEDEDLLWVISGGGWRSMYASMGYASVMSSIGLFPGDGNSPFDLLAGSSGGTFFLSQFFYSPEFFQAMTSLTGDDFETFVSNWYDGLVALWSQHNDPSPPECGPLKQAASQLNATAVGLSDLAQSRIRNLQLLNFIACDPVFSLFQYSTLSFFQEMIAFGANTYSDNDLANTLVTEENKVTELKNVDVNFQTTLFSSARSSDGSLKFLGPKDKDDTVYRIQLPVQWSSSGKWLPEGVFSSLRQYAIDDPEDFSFEDYDEYFPDDGGSFTSPLSGSIQGAEVLNLSTPATPTVGQIVAAASSSLANRFFASPSLSSGFYMPLRDAPASAGDVDNYFQTVWDTDFVKRAAICNTWDELECPKSAWYFMDGVQTNDFALALSVATLQKKHNVDNHRTSGYGPYAHEEKKLPKLKVIMTSNANTFGDPRLTYDQILQFWATESNQGISPGGYMPFQEEAGPRFPRQSKQIFKESLANVEALKALLTPIEDAAFNTTHPVEATGIPNAESITAYAEFDLTTVDNPAYGVKGGQQVRLLFLENLSAIPTDPLGAAFTAAFKQDHVDLAKAIGNSDGVRTVIDNFVNGGV